MTRRRVSRLRNTGWSIVLALSACGPPAVGGGGPGPEGDDATPPLGRGGASGTGGRGGEEPPDAARGTAGRGGADGGVDGPAMDGPATPTGTGGLTFTPEGGTFRDTVELRLASDQPGATIHYTLDDSTPTKASTVYTGPIKLTATTSVRAFVSSPAGDGPVQNRGYARLSADAAAFSSDLPILLIHSRLPWPLLKVDGVREAVLQVFEPDPQTGRATLTQRPTLNTRLGINVRGSSSETGSKKQYKLELWDGAANIDKDRPLLGLPPESDWIINSGFAFDRAYVRNALVYALSNRLGRYAPRTRFAEVIYTQKGADVTVATDYMGLYTLMEKIKVAKNRVAIAKLGTMDNDEPAVSGGYIFKIDRVDTGEAGLTSGTGPAGIWNQPCAAGRPGICKIFQIGRIAFHDPSEAVLTAKQKAYVKAQTDAFANALAAKGDYAQYIDVPSFIDHHALSTLTKNPDNFRLSEYFYKDRGGKIFAGPMWDYDRTMGCAGDARAAKPTAWDANFENTDTTSAFEFGWYRGLFDDPTFKTAYFRRLKELLAGDLSAAKLEALVDELVKQLGAEAPARDAKRWPAAAPRGGSLAAEVTMLKSWLRTRVTWMTGCLALPDPEMCPP